MASQVLSGVSNPSYTNNTGQNVRIVINFMVGTPFRAENRGFSQSTFTNVLISPLVPSTITINWAGVSATSSSNVGDIVIGRNLAYSQLFRDVVPGTIIPSGSPNPFIAPVDPTLTQTTGLASVANNAGGSMTRPLPTELILAPGQTFSAVCSVHNIVVIPENG